MKSIGSGMDPTHNLSKDNIMAKLCGGGYLSNLTTLVALGTGAVLVYTADSPMMLDCMARHISYEEVPVPEVGLDKATVCRRDGLCRHVEAVAV